MTGDLPQLPDLSGRFYQMRYEERLSALTIYLEAVGDAPAISIIFGMARFVSLAPQGRGFRFIEPDAADVSVGANATGTRSRVFAFETLAANTMKPQRGVIVAANVELRSG